MTALSRPAVLEWAEGLGDAGSLRGDITPLLSTAGGARSSVTRVIAERREREADRRLTEIRQRERGPAWAFAQQGTLDIDQILRNLGARVYEQRAAELLVSAHHAYVMAFRSSHPDLLAIFEQHLASEAMLNVFGEHPNRDHIFHQLAVAFVARTLLREHTPADDNTRDALAMCLDFHGHGILTSDHSVIIAAAVLAGLLHDSDYPRYILQAQGRVLAETFRQEEYPQVPVGQARLRRRLQGSHLRFLLDTCLSDKAQKALGGIDTWLYLIHLIDAATDADLHGQRVALRLLAYADELRQTGCASAAVESVLQLAATFCFLHHIHEVGVKSTSGRHYLPAHPDLECVRRDVLRSCPLIRHFCLADEVSCFGRPEYRLVWSRGPYPAGESTAEEFDLSWNASTSKWQLAASPAQAAEIRADLQRKGFRSLIRVGSRRRSSARRSA